MTQTEDLVGLVRPDIGDLQFIRETNMAKNIMYEDQTSFNFESLGDCGNGNHCGQLPENVEIWLPKVLPLLNEDKK